MCAALELSDTHLRPGKIVPAWGRLGVVRLVWAGFARSESLGWWKRQGGELLDVPAHRFAERSDRDRQLRWDALPAGLVVRGLLDPHDGQPLLKIVTRASTAEELARFEHPRMPLLEAPLFSSEIIVPLPDPTRARQGELFP